MANSATKKNAFYAQSGGVTAVINASACGVIQACREHKDKIGTLYAGQNGIIGALQDTHVTRPRGKLEVADVGRHAPQCLQRGAVAYKRGNMPPASVCANELIRGCLKAKPPPKLATAGRGINSM